VSDAGLAVELRGDVAVVTLQNERKRNALNPTMLEAFCTTLDTLPGRGARAVVLTGAGSHFSSGYDISALPESMPPVGEVKGASRGASQGPVASGTPAVTMSPFGRALAAVADGPLPVVAALNGPAIGGGLELAATCDLRVAHAEVTLLMPPVRLGIVYPPMGLSRFVALVGMSRAREIFLTAQPVPASRALAWGLVDRVVERDAVLPCALELAAEMARGAPLALAGTRRAFEHLLPAVDDAGAAELAHVMHEAWQSEDAAEARAAFREKRKPVFKGK
jgi:enoyl-CoA hydratase/carnithine racemase